MTIKELKAILKGFNKNEQDCEIVFCVNPSEDVCKDYMIDGNGCSMQFDRENKKWKAVFYLEEVA